MHKLKQRWGIQSNFQLVVILVVFAINGSASAKLGFFLLDCFGMTEANTNGVLRYILMLILVTPIYPFLIMLTGWLFGQSEFFVRFGKNMLNRISFGLLFDYKKNA